MNQASIDFVTELRKWSENKDLVSGILKAVALSPAILENPTSDTGVEGFYLYPRETVFTAWVIKNKSIILHERNLEGLTLTITFPGTRIRRVSEENNRLTTSVTLEFDADRTVFTAQASQSDDGMISLTGNSLHSGYTITVNTDDSNELQKFDAFIVAVKELITI